MVSVGLRQDANSGLRTPHPYLLSCNADTLLPALDENLVWQTQFPLYSRSTWIRGLLEGTFMSSSDSTVAVDACGSLNLQKGSHQRSVVGYKWIKLPYHM